MKALALRFALVLCGWIAVGATVGAQTASLEHADAAGFPAMGVIGVCQLVNQIDNGGRGDQRTSPIYVASPSQAVSAFVLRVEKTFLDYTKNVQVTVLQVPMHGELKDDGGKIFDICRHQAT